MAEAAQRPASHAFGVLPVRWRGGVARRVLDRPEEEVVGLTIQSQLVQSVEAAARSKPSYSQRKGSGALALRVRILDAATQIALAEVSAPARQTDDPAAVVVPAPRSAEARAPARKQGHGAESKAVACVVDSVGSHDAVGKRD
uniref:Uncharacterized protein n=1 Tax=Haptolina ericina TaxID=156174 RepID=A0A7S3FIK7_9EUKA|mmetsp:Transcript_73163/g.162482  ORF Transcript_73163/g.162482 Transcript_73163/m.162482 type:complete len:143 (+) Transcript_73163:411-839(+)